MKVYRISKCDYISDLSGTGAALYPGRWHSKGTYVLYTAASQSLAMLETIVHVTSLVKIDLCMICLQLPDTGVHKITRQELPENWYQMPSPDFLKVIGDHFIKEQKHLALQVPSAIVSEEYNYLINPAHPQFKQVKLLYTKQVHLDQRLIKK